MSDTTNGSLVIGIKLREHMPSWLREALRLLFEGFVLILLAWLSLVYFQIAGLMTFLWLPAGLVSSCFLLIPKRKWLQLALVFLLSDLAVHLFSGGAFLPSLIISVADVITGCITAALIQFFIRTSFSFETTKNALVFFGSILGASAAGALLAAGAFLFQPGWNYLDYWLGWFVSALLGSLVVMPLVLIWRHPHEKMLFIIFEDWKRLVEGSIIWLLLLGIESITYFFSLPTVFFSYFGPLLIFPFLAWSAARLSLRFVSLILSLTSVIMLLGSSLGPNLHILGGIFNIYSVYSTQLSVLLFLITGLLLSVLRQEYKIANQTVAKSEALLNETQAVAKTGGWEYDVHSRKMVWTEQVYNIFGLPTSFNPDDFKADASYFPPEERKQLLQDFADAVNQGKPFDLEVPFKNAQGKSMWVRLRGTAQAQAEEEGAEAGVAKVTGTITDISNRKEAELALASNEELLRLAMEATSDGLWDYRCDENITHYSESYLRMLGYELGKISLLSTEFLELVHPEDQNKVRQILTQSTTGMIDNFEIEFRIHAHLAGWKWILCRAKTVSWDKYGKPLRVVGTHVDITARKQAEEDLRKANVQLEQQALINFRMQSLLEEQATHDALTGLYNRRFLNEHFSRELKRAMRDRRPISVMMIDVDNFKIFNDNYGHEVGDQVLVSLSRLLGANIRGSDVACRHGGDEFVVVMTEAGLEDAMQRAEQIRRQFSEQRTGFEELAATISIGVAAFPNHGNAQDEIIRAADEALYKAKSAGRNCIRSV